MNVSGHYISSCQFIRNMNKFNHIAVESNVHMKSFSWTGGNKVEQIWELEADIKRYGEQCLSMNLSPFKKNLHMNQG